MGHLQKNALSTYSDQIDQVLLAPRITEQETIEGCHIAKELRVTNVWVKPCYVHQTMKIFHNGSLNVGTFIGYPYGISTTYVKLAETKRALSEGVNLLALALNVGDMIAGKSTEILEEISCVSGLAHMNGVSCLVMIISSLVNKSQLLSSAEAVKEGGTEGIIIKSESFEDQKIKPLIDDFNISEWQNHSKCIHLPIMVTKDELNAFLQAGFDRVGLPIITKNNLD